MPFVALGINSAMTVICVDASLVLAWLLPEELSAKAFALKEQWDEQGTELVAPALLHSEVPSVLRQSVYRGRIALDEGDEAFQSFLEMSIRIREPEGLLAQAWALGKAVNAPRLYDVFYLALAEMQGCEFWTADRRLANLVASRSTLARWVGDFTLEDAGG